jgi:hypothetical protein
MAFAFSATAFGLSISTLHQCNFISGTIMYYNDDIIGSNNQGALGPNIVKAATFSIGIFKMRPIFRYTCFRYTDKDFKDSLDVGAAEWIARSAGSLAAIIGGVCTILLLVCGLSRTRAPGLSKGIGWTLIVTAVLQLLTLALFASKLCRDDYWDDYWDNYLSGDYQIGNVNVMVSCTFSGGAFRSIAALVIYIGAAAITFFHWTGDGTKVFEMGWAVKQVEEDGGGTMATLDDQRPLVVEKKQRDEIISDVDVVGLDEA